MEDLITKATNDFVAGMQKSGNFARIQIIALIRGLDTEDGKLIPSDRNNQLIDGASIGIQQVALSGTFNARVNKVINSIPKIRKQTERAFIVRNGVISGTVTTRITESQNTVQGLISDTIGERSVINEVMTPMISILNQIVINQMPIDSAIQLATEKIPSLFTQFAHTRVSTPLQIFVRDINKIMADSKGLKWFKYSGPTGFTPLGNPIRDFCKHRVNGVFLDQEIALWPQKFGPWDGMIQGTNSFNIFLVLGGYNCRHDLIPVKGRDVPNKDRARARRAGMI